MTQRNKWLASEVHKMKRAHVGARPSRAEIYAMFPRHSVHGVSMMLSRLGLQRPLCRRVKPPMANYQRWLRIAHEHFARREAGMLA